MAPGVMRSIGWVAVTEHDDDLRVVLSGLEPDGAIWQVRAGWNTACNHLATVLLYGVSDDNLQSVGGFGGPPLYDGEDVNDWCGQSTGTPSFVVVRASPEIITVQAVVSCGRHVALRMSEVVPEFGLRFGAARLPEGVSPRDVVLSYA